MPTASYGCPGDLACGYSKDPVLRFIQFAAIRPWQSEVERLQGRLRAPPNTMNERHQPNFEAGVFATAGP